VFLAYLGVQLFVGLLVGMVGGILAVLSGGPGNPGAVLVAVQQVILPASFIGLVGGGLTVYALARRSLPGSLGSGALRPIGWNAAPPRALLLAILAGLGLAALYLLVLVPAAPSVSGQHIGTLAGAASLGGWYRHGWAVLLLLIAPPVEEFVFRGVLMAGFASAWTTGTAGTVVAFLFWLLHFADMQSYGPALIAVALVAGATVVARVTADSLVPAIVLHASYNLGIVIAVYAGAA
jgi:membrane protease YdiL (CAAX protease family)